MTAPLIHRLGSALRRFYWKRVRRYRYEICGSAAPPSEGREVIKRYGCGRPVGLVWTAPTGLWDRIVDPHERMAGEGAGGILCVHCFDRACEDRNTFLRWVPEHL